MPGAEGQHPPASDGPAVAERLAALRARARAGEERLESIVRAVESLSEDFRQRLEATERAVGERVSATHAKAGELEARIAGLAHAEADLRSHLGATVEQVKDWVNGRVEELGRNLAERLEAVHREEKEVEARMRRFEELGEKLRAVVFATESLGPGLKEIVAAMDEMRSSLGVSVEGMAEIRETLTDSIEDLSQSRWDLQKRLEALEAGVAAMRAELDQARASYEDLRSRLVGLGERLATQREELGQAVEKARLELDAAVRDAQRLVEEAFGQTVIRPDEFPYFRFEDTHRGSPETVRDALRPFVRHFHRCQRVVDLGCGRGEFLDLCKQEGIGAYGVDSNEDMVLHCQRIGLNVVHADVVDHLRELKDKSVDGVFCSQVIEHLPMRKVHALLRECHRVLKVGTNMVLVTINPLSLYTLAHNFFLDPTHVRPIPPETLRFLVEEAGFRKTSIAYFSPFGPEFSLLPVRFEGETEEQRAIRINFDRLNHVVFGNQEYALLALK